MSSYHPSFWDKLVQFLPVTFHPENKEIIIPVIKFCMVRSWEYFFSNISIFWARTNKVIFVFNINICISSFVCALLSNRVSCCWLVKINRPKIIVVVFLFFIENRVKLKVFWRQLILKVCEGTHMQCSTDFSSQIIEYQISTHLDFSYLTSGICLTVTLDITLLIWIFKI